MDPATIAGLVLGVVPLIISAVENYEVIFQPFVTYRRYSKEIARFTTRLDTQKAIFNNQCQCLLSKAERSGGYNVVLDNILKDPKHPARKDKELSDRLEGLLGVSVRTCIETLGLIQQMLGEIARETEGFQDLTEKKPGERTRFSHFRSKIKISFSKTRLNDIVNELRLYNEDLRVLSTQVSAIIQEGELQQTLIPPIVFEFQTTQQASEKLHSLLVARWICNNKVDHAANLSLDLQIPQKCNPLGTRFSLSMTCISEGSKSAEDAVWLNIESTMTREEKVVMEPKKNDKGDTSSMTITMNELRIATGAIESQLMATAKPPNPSITKLVEPSVMVSKIANSTPSPEKLCSYFHSQPQQPALSVSSAIYSQTTHKFEYVVCKCQSPPGCINKTKSLQQILQDDADLRRREAWSSKFKLARLLTLGVLRFQSTPWLRKTLNNSDIHFLENETPTKAHAYSLEEPFVRIELSRESKNLCITENNKASHLPQNELLFNLGVLLLELGYDAPLRTLRSAEDLKDGETDESWYTDFFTAKRLGKSAPRELDARYGRLAKKCLDCDFGVGDDLDSVELQSAIVRDVVQELDECLRLEESINSYLLF